ncbi:hypothetical protein IFM53868_00034 [Aspergillus udagawae]|uniref:Uncharacterized protein n=1 Tax=Aspergillus udagawae TaxID=91492 RepID=A0ABQ0ZYP2_9EURO|nr:hypothetical protein IFM53868_00034 [Aspergillus udagawae]
MVQDSWTLAASAGHRDLERTIAEREETVQETLGAGDTGVGVEVRHEGVELGTLGAGPRVTVGGDHEDRSQDEGVPWVQEVQEGEAREGRWVPSLAAVAAHEGQGLDQLLGADLLEASRDGKKDKTEERLLAASDRV